MKRLSAYLAIVFFVVGTSLLFAQKESPLGPKDGAGLPPTDLERIQVGSVAPDFTLESKEDRLITLSEYRGKKDVVLVFYRGHW